MDLNARLEGENKETERERKSSENLYQLESSEQQPRLQVNKRSGSRMASMIRRKVEAGKQQIESKNKYMQKAKTRGILYTSLIYLFLYLQPNFVQQIMAVIACRSIAGKNYVGADLSKECYTSDYYLYLYSFLIPGLILFLIIIPYMLFRPLYRAAKPHPNPQNPAIMYQRYEGLNDPSFKFKYGFIYNEYRSQIYFWEFFKIYQKILISVFIQLYEQYVKIKGILALLIIIFYGVMSQKNQPYSSKRLNAIDIESTIICGVSVLLGVFIKDNEFSYWVWISYIIIILINAYFILEMLGILFHEYTMPLRKKIRDQLRKFTRFSKAKVSPKRLRDLKYFLRKEMRLYIQFLNSQKKPFEETYKEFLEYKKANQVNV